MAIQDADAVWRKSDLLSDIVPAANGGRINIGSVVATGIKNNLFPDVTQAQRLAGATHYRKAFVHINTVAASELLNAKLFLDEFTPGGDFMLLYQGTPSDTQDAIPARPFGVAKLKLGSPIVATDVTILVEVENIASYTALTPFRVGDVLRISDRIDTIGAGNEEFKIIQTVTYNATDISITFTTAFTNAYLDTNPETIISSVLEYASIKPSVNNKVVTSVAGLFDETLLVLGNQFTEEQIWTLTFTAPTTYNVSCDTLGITGTAFSVSTDGILSDVTGTRLIIKPGCFNGTFAIGETVVFHTHGAYVPLWYCRIIPENCASIASDYCSVAIQGESA